MIEASEFVEAGLALGYGWYTGVPCSFLTPLINYAIATPRLTYVSSPNEGDAVATAAGAVLGGRRAVVMLQNSGLGNAVSPLASLTWPFRIPLLLIVTLRGDPERGDEPQHELMGQITPGMLEQLQIPWSWFPEQRTEIAPTLARAQRHLDEAQRPYALILRKGAVAPFALPDPTAGLSSAGGTGAQCRVLQPRCAAARHARRSVAAHRCRHR